MLEGLRTQVVSLENPLWAAVAWDGLISRPIGDLLVEVVMWDLDDAAEHTVTRGDARLGGLDDQTILMLARAQSVVATSDTIKFVPVTVAGLDAEIAASNAYYLGACMLEMMFRAEPGSLHVIVPVSFHAWIVHAVTPNTGPETVEAMRELARTILDQTPLSVTERLGETPLWWPGNGRPDKMPPWR